jgi:hypothetical protein
MSSWETFSRPIAALEIIGEESGPASLRSVSALLTDLNLAYEISLLATNPVYENFKFNNFVWSRNRRPVRREDLLRVAVLSMQSPLDLLAWVPMFGAVGGGLWGLMQVAEKVRDWKVNGQIRRLERDRLARELGAAPNDDSYTEEQFQEALRRRGAEPYYEETIVRIAKNEITITQVRVRNDVPRFDQ